MKNANDYNGLLLFYSCTGSRDKLKELGEKCLSEGVYNIAFPCFFQINDIDNCLDVLIKSNRIPEASLFCRTYCPSKLSSVLELWNEELSKTEDQNSRTSKINIYKINLVIKVGNPLDNFNNLEQYESLIGRYYNLVASSESIEINQDLAKFLDIDLEQLLNEGNDLNDINISELLKKSDD